jgi:phage terminase small subunit
MYRVGLLFDYRHEEPKQPKPLCSGLNEQQWRFIHAYCKRTPSGTMINTAKQAAIEAGYSPKSASDAAYRLIKNRMVKYFIELRLGERKTLREIRDRAIHRATQSSIGRLL